MAFLFLPFPPRKSALHPHARSLPDHPWHLSKSTNDYALNGCAPSERGKSDAPHAKGVEGGLSFHRWQVFGAV